MIAWNRLFALVLAAALVAGANAWLNPDRPAWSEAALGEDEIRLADVIGDESVLWLDARPLADHGRDRIPGALPLNEDDWQSLLPEVLAAWQPGQRVVVYCGGGQCQSSHSVAGRLRGEVGLDEVYVLKGGWEAWQARGK